MYSNAITKKMVLVFFLAGLTLPAMAETAAVKPAAGKDSANKMRAAFARMDKEDFLDGIETAEACLQRGNLDCADDALREARELISGDADERLWRMASTNVAAERKRVRQREEEEGRQRREEERRVAQEEAEERRQQNAFAEQERRRAMQYGMNSLALALVGGKNMDPQQLNTLMEANKRDYEQGGNGSNLQASLNEMKADNERRSQDAQKRNQARAAQRQQEQEATRRELAQQRSIVQNERASAPVMASAASTAPSGPTAAQRQQQEEKARQERAAQQAADNKARDEAAVLAEQERQQRLAKQKADREAQRAAEKAKEDAEKKEYLRQTAQQTTLKARMCYGKSYVVGIRPRIKPEKVPCVDMHYRARCAGSQAYVTGVVKNFVGMGTDCFTGDTADMPAMSCPVADITLEVTQAVTCGG